MLTRCFAFIYTPNTKEMTSFTRTTLPAVTLRRIEDITLVTDYEKITRRCNYTNGLQLPILSIRWVVLTVIYFE